MPAPYMGRNKWVLLTDINAVKPTELQTYIRQSYELIKSKLTKKSAKNSRWNKNSFEF
ncbi:hypothetical protein ACFQ21_26160 [Ohtaekwangia kribbensis]|uniref:YjbR protein n=1 Tax=Ohtaekwangia kribbensis TaxID=688913 RepID=A0ABW3KBV8_9BACT